MKNKIQQTYTLPIHIVTRMKDSIEPRKISQFVAVAIERALKEDESSMLASLKEMQEDIEQFMIAKEFDCCAGDGIDEER